METPSLLLSQFPSNLRYIPNDFLNNLILINILFVNGFFIKI